MLQWKLPRVSVTNWHFLLTTKTVNAFRVSKKMNQGNVFPAGEMVNFSVLRLPWNHVMVAVASTRVVSILERGASNARAMAVVGVRV